MIGVLRLAPFLETPRPTLTRGRVLTQWRPSGVRSIPAAKPRASYLSGRSKPYARPLLARSKQRAAITSQRHEAKRSYRCCGCAVEQCGDSRLRLQLRIRVHRHGAGESCNHNSNTRHGVPPTTNGQTRHRVSALQAGSDSYQPFRQQRYYATRHQVPAIYQHKHSNLQLARVPDDPATYASRRKARETCAPRGFRV